MNKERLNLFLSADGAVVVCMEKAFSNATVCSFSKLITTSVTCSFTAIKFICVHSGLPLCAVKPALSQVQISIA